MHEPFGRYGLLRRLAVGGMAEIFLAALHGDEGFEKKVVLKRILPHLGQDADFVRMFIDEAMVASRLSHPNIIEVYDFGHAEGSYFMAMEYVEGIDLHQVLQQAKVLGQRLTVAEVAAIGERIARGLAYTHNLIDDDGVPLSIVHRDVSPHNIMISHLGAVKVMDFGIAKAAARATRTVTGTIKGKLAYMSPEQARGESATKLSDQFALGIVLWECLVGRKLFEGESDVTLLQRVAACNVPNLTVLCPEVPPSLSRIVQRALSCNPNSRYADLEELADALTAVRYSLGAAGIVKLDDVVNRYAVRGQETQSWSWAEQQVASSGGGTRVLAAPPAEPSSGPKTRKLRGAMTPARAHHATGRRPLLRHRSQTTSKPLEPTRIERLPWLLVGALLAALVTVAGRTAEGLKPLQALSAMIIQLFAF